MLITAIEQALNGIQLGVTLFLITAGLTLTFGIMGVINLAHGSLFMVGAYVGAVAGVQSGSFALGIAAALAASGVLGLLIELSVIRVLYRRDHLDQVLATFALIFIFNGCTSWIFGRQPLLIDVPPFLGGVIDFTPDFSYPRYRMALIVAGLAIAALLYYTIARTRIGMLVRAGSTHRELVRALGVNVPGLFAIIFAFGSALAGLAGALVGPVRAVEVGMGDHMVILALVVIVIGGIGSVRGAMVASLLVGLVDTLGRSLLPQVLKAIIDPGVASSVGVALSATSVYLLMAVVLLIRPAGLFAGRV
ncbi:MAG: branched-chain amino acid ABC transporter permease [Betaproteobacteria bacterium]|nr:branched-chain amino acid ABC transporter permease [Betaproteobacteria bacterium]